MKESEINMASIVTRSYACDVEVSGKGRNKGVQIETNKNENRDGEMKRELKTEKERKWHKP
jgi:hypothetical protein